MDALGNGRYQGCGMDAPGNGRGWAMDAPVAWMHSEVEAIVRRISEAQI